MKNKGFTLIELLAVITIIAIIALIVTPNIIGNVNNYKNKLNDTQLKNIESAARMWGSDNLYILPTNANANTTCYYNSISNCPDEYSTLIVDLVTLQAGGYISDDIKNIMTKQNISNLEIEIDKVGNKLVYEVLYDSYTKETSPFKLGDYVEMTPSVTSYTTDTNMTGYSETQTINPRELNLWRVIRINNDGTVDMVSEYVSSVNIYFSGINGYKNYVGYLNTLARQYENSKYTKRSRYMGYNGQTEFITDTSAFDGTSNNVTWTSSSPTTANQKTTDEDKGSGDTLYTEDTGLLTTAGVSLSPLQCNNTSCSNPTTAANYWIASRYYYYRDTNYFDFNGYFVNDGAVRSQSIQIYNNNWNANNNSKFALRPIVTLKATTKIDSGAGTSASHYKLK